MSKMLRLLTEQPFSVLVSLPRNEAALAAAAIRGGAAALKVHLNVHHHASGTHYGSFQEERAALESILQAADGRPVGIVPGGTPFATAIEFRELAAMGVDFFDAYPGDAPAWTLRQGDLEPMLAAFDGGSVELMTGLEAVGMAMCEVSIVSKDEYGQELNTLDLARYRELTAALKVPCIIPSQKKLMPEDCLSLHQAGAKGVLIGAIVTGATAEGIEKNTQAFVHAAAKIV